MKKIFISTGAVFIILFFSISSYLVTGCTDFNTNFSFQNDEDEITLVPTLPNNNNIFKRFESCSGEYQLEVSNSNNDDISISVSEISLNTDLGANVVSVDKIISEKKINSSELLYIDKNYIYEFSFQNLSDDSVVTLNLTKK